MSLMFDHKDEMSLFMPGLLQNVLMTLTFYVSIFSWQQIIYTPVQMLFMWLEFLYDLYVSEALVCSFLPYTVKTDQTSHNWENQNQLRQIHMWRHKKSKTKSEQIQGVKQFAYFFMQWPVGCSHICWSLLDIYIHQSSGPTFFNIYYFKSITSSECFRNWYTLHIVEYLMFVYDI